MKLFVLALLCVFLLATGADARRGRNKKKKHVTLDKEKVLRCISRLHLFACTRRCTLLSLSLSLSVALLLSMHRSADDVARTTKRSLVGVAKLVFTVLYQTHCSAASLPHVRTARPGHQCAS
jgi:hypothetical protein